MEPWRGAAGPSSSTCQVMAASSGAAPEATALPLIYCDEDGVFQVGKEALGVLNSIADRLGELQRLAPLLV